MFLSCHVFIFMNSSKAIPLLAYICEYIHLSRTCTWFTFHWLIAQLLGPGLAWSPTQCSSAHIHNLAAGFCRVEEDPQVSFLQWLAQYAKESSSTRPIPPCQRTSASSKHRLKPSSPLTPLKGSQYLHPLAYPNRGLFGKYLQWTVQHACHTASEQGVDVKVIRKEVTKIRRDSHTANWKIECLDGSDRMKKDGLTFSSDAIVLCIGPAATSSSCLCKPRCYTKSSYPDPSIPFGRPICPFKSHPQSFEPWPVGSWSSLIPRDASVAVVGSGSNKYSLFWALARKNMFGFMQIYMSWPFWATASHSICFSFFFLSFFPPCYRTDRRRCSPTVACTRAPRPSPHGLSDGTPPFYYLSQKHSSHCSKWKECVHRHRHRHRHRYWEFHSLSQASQLASFARTFNPSFPTDYWGSHAPSPF